MTVGPRPAAERYSRQVAIPQVGEAGQQRISAAKVCVVGAGGLGSPALMYLAAAGVGVLGVVDDDLVDLSNLQRQVIHGQATLGQPKVHSAAARIADLNPLVTVQAYQVRLTASNALRILADYDVVIDGTDNFGTRYLVNDACALLGKPCIWGAVQQFQGQVSVFWAGRGPCYRCVFPIEPPAGSVPSCAEGGVLGAVCATIGAAQATEAFKLIVGIGQPLIGRLALYDALSAEWNPLRILADPQCPVCGDAPTITRASGLMATDSREQPTVPGIAPDDLARLLAERAVTLVDVRELSETRSGSIAGARRLPLATVLNGQAKAQLSRDQPLVIHCAFGQRSLIAAQALLAAGFTDVRHLAGGLSAWRAAGQPLAAPDSAES